MSEELRQAWHPAHAAHLMARLTEQGHGLLPNLQRVVEDAAQCCLGLPGYAGSLVYAELAYAAGRLESVRRQIEVQSQALTRQGNPAPTQAPPAPTHRPSSGTTAPSPARSSPHR
ncbi:hypothetical protein [Streptomyces sp. NPDC058989]|uniref:hypothetical protein n=1 Tax=Streptomyces sp. NPDC058989 TaxID=3346686 RepID=UPI0036CCB854